MVLRILNSIVPNREVRNAPRFLIAALNLAVAHETEWVRKRENLNEKSSKTSFRDNREVIFSYFLVL